VPAANLFETAEKVHAPVEALPLVARGSEHAGTSAHEQAASARSLAMHAAKPASRRHHGRHAGRTGHQRARVANADRSASEREVSDNARQKPPVRIASLKKR